MRLSISHLQHLDRAGISPLWIEQDSFLASFFAMCRNQSINLHSIFRFVAPFLMCWGEASSLYWEFKREEKSLLKKYVEKNWHWTLSLEQRNVLQKVVTGWVNFLWLTNSSSLHPVWLTKKRVFTRYTEELPSSVRWKMFIQFCKLSISHGVAIWASEKSSSSVLLGFVDGWVVVSLMYLFQFMCNGLRLDILIDSRVYEKSIKHGVRLTTDDL